MRATERELDRQNAEFWDTLCGWAMAQSVGITGDTEDDLRRFDEAYLAYYPYLEKYVRREPLSGRPVLEIGLGFGTLGQLLFHNGADYHAVDVARAPVELMRRRLAFEGVDPEGRVLQASALELPFEDGTFAYVYSIGCLHHTGDLARAVVEIHRVLRPGGRAVVMLYNRRSVRHLLQPARALVSPEWRSEFASRIRGLYDFDPSGETAPHIDFVTRREARRLFAVFERIRIDAQNFPEYRLGDKPLRRQWFLTNLARVIGLDLYIVADKAPRPA